MTLPASPIPTGVVTVNGTDVPVRGLSRTEALHMSELEGVQAAEVYVLSTGAGVTPEEAERWLGEVTNDVADLLTDKILRLSGLLGRDGKDPQPSPSDD
jgi:hypothetical protein